MYRKQNRNVWDLLRKNRDPVKETQHHEFLMQISKKLKWIKMIESGHVSIDAIREEYKDADTLLRTKCMNKVVDENIFIASKELKNSVSNFITKNVENIG